MTAIKIMKGIDSTVYADNIILAGRQAGRQGNFCLICAVNNSTDHRITMHCAR